MAKEDPLFELLKLIVSAQVCMIKKMDNTALAMLEKAGKIINEEALRRAVEDANAAIERDKNG